MIAVVIPAFEPPPALCALTRALLADARIRTIVVVDDGSDDRFEWIFRQIAADARVTVLRHARNRGKGAALKTGFRHLLDREPSVSVVVTADADGQHLPDDILAVASRGLALPDALIIGVRDLGTAAPPRSRVGNRITRALYRCIVGQPLRDTQSGLRSFPSRLLRHLVAVEGTAYEYELQVLIWCRQAQVALVELPIRTVYLDGNRTSHFKPFGDSCRVYAVLLRFGAVSTMSACLDNLVFLLGVWSAGLPEAGAFFLGRVVSAAFHYPTVRACVFPRAGGHSRVLAPYLVLLVSNVIVARFVMSNLQTLDGMSVLAAKLITEAAFFLPNFLLQRDVVFRSSAATRSGGTDWTAYYASVPFTARWTRRYTARVLVRALDEAARLAGPIRRIAELGGANSCFLDHVCRSFAPDAYVVVDNNPFGLAQLAGWKPPRHASTTLTVHEADVRSLRAEGDLDTAFSVGLIEHFDRADTRRVLTSHFELVRRGGAVVVSYPTPTWLYRITRRLLEGVRLWRFPDERALTFAEVQSAVGTLGEVVSRRLVWPLVLTQEMVVFRKR